MIRSGVILAAILIVSICFLFIVPESMHLPVRVSVEIIIGVAGTGFLLLVFYKLMDIRLRVRIKEELRKDQEQIPAPRHIPIAIMNSLNIYNSIATTNYWVYRTLGVISLASSLFLTIAIGQDKSVIETYVTQLIAYVAALSTGIIFTFNLVEKSNRARRAFRVLQNGIMLYRYKEVEMPVLLEKYREAEDLLGDDEFKQSSSNGLDKR